MEKISGFHAQHFYLQRRRVDGPEYTRTVDDIGEDFSGERHCFIEVQIPNTIKFYCLRITFSFNPQGSSWTVNRRQFFL